MKKFQKILNGQIKSSIEIKDEMQTLTNSGRELEAALPELEKTLEKARTALLAETGAMDEIKRAEEAISENKNKILGISGIIKDLEVALKKALVSESIKKNAEITREIAAIDKDVLEIRQEALSHFAKAAILINKILGNERSDFNLNYDFFHRCDLSTELQNKIDAGIADQEGVSLSTRREQLQMQSNHLSKKSI